MISEANNNKTVRVGATICTEVERDSAMDFGFFLHDEWLESQKHEIIKLDKTNYDNNESANNN